jgi:hypothetical protein
VRARGPSRSGAAVDVVDADDVVLVEVAEGYLEYPNRAVARRGEPVDRLPADKELFFRLGVDDLPVQLHADTGIQYHPQLVALVVILATERAARDYRDDLYSAWQVVGVLLEPAPRSLYLYRWRHMIQTQPPFAARGKFRLSAPACGEPPLVAI